MTNSAISLFDGLMGFLIVWVWLALEIEQHWSSGLASLGWIVGLGISKRHVFVGDRNKKAREKYHGLNLAV